MSKDLKYKVGDLVKIIDDWFIRREHGSISDREHYETYIGKVGIIEEVDLSGSLYYVRFADGESYSYETNDLEIPTEDEEDRYYLERYKYV